MGVFTQLQICLRVLCERGLGKISSNFAKVLIKGQNWEGFYFLSRLFANEPLQNVPTLPIITIVCGNRPMQPVGVLAPSPVKQVVFMVLLVKFLREKNNGKKEDAESAMRHNTLQNLTPPFSRFIAEGPR